MQKSITELNQIKASFDKLDAQIKTKMEDKANQPSDLERDMYQMISYIHTRINYLQEDFYHYTSQHQKGHLPPITDAGKLEEALQKMGLGDSYQVIKPVVFASTSKNGQVVEGEILR